MQNADLSLGDRGGIISQFSQTLVRHGYLSSDTELFHEEMQSAVKAFQQDRGLTVTGIISPTTYRALEDARWKLGDRVISLTSPTLMRGDDVSALQTRLSEMGFNCGKIDGFFGPLTDKAVRDFQKSVGARVDGACGPATIMSLLRLMKTVAGGAPTGLREEAMRAERGPALANKVIVLDPSSADGDAEITFDIAQRLEGRLIALGVSVFLTRSATNKPSESARITFANSVNADLVIALNTDSYQNDKAHGVATYFYGNEIQKIHSLVGERFATLVQREITARTDLLNCRTHAKTWDFLRLTKAPAVRIDLGYLSHPGDFKKLSDSIFRETIVESLIISIQRLYLSAESDAKTGTLKLSDLRRAGLRSH